MRIIAFASAAAFAIALAGSPLTVGLPGTAFAKGGNSGGHGGGNGEGGSGSHGGEAKGTSNGHATTAKGVSPSSEHTSRSKVEKGREKNVTAQLGGLNSLKRNYKALLNSSDPKMVAIAAYARAYAEYEIANGSLPAIDDPVLGDVALEDALKSAAHNKTITPAMLAQAKSILGVGDAIGKIDQIRDSLEPQELSTTEPTEPQEASAELQQ